MGEIPTSAYFSRAEICGDEDHDHGDGTISVVEWLWLWMVTAAAAVTGAGQVRWTSASTSI